MSISVEVPAGDDGAAREARSGAVYLKCPVSRD
jgi:hypothetical protein